MTIVGGIQRTFSLLALLSGALLSAQALPSPPSDSPDGPNFRNPASWR
jgi:hypothetical protein